MNIDIKKLSIEERFDLLQEIVGCTDVVIKSAYGEFEIIDMTDITISGKEIHIKTYIMTG